MSSPTNKLLLNLLQNEDIVGHILSYLPSKDRIKSLAVSKTWNAAINLLMLDLPR